jgi:hypothetical protein
MHVRLLLTQKIFACAAEHIRLRSGFLQTRHSTESEPAESKLPIRYTLVQQPRRGQGVNSQHALELPLSKRLPIIVDYVSCPMKHKPSGPNRPRLYLWT